MLQSVLVGFDASAVWGAAVSRGLGGPRLRAFARAPLAAGALQPSPVEANLAGPADVREALHCVAATLQVGRSPVTLVLPDGVARIAWLPLSGTSVAPLEFARYRLLPGLPFPADEAIVDALAAGPAGAVGAAVRRRVVAEYEAAAEEAGLRRQRVDLAPLAALAALQREPPGAPLVDVILSDAAVTLAARDGGGLRLVRNRRRADGPELAWLAQEADRTAAAAGLATPELRVVGSGARALVAAWSAGGRAARTGWEVEGQASAHGVETAGLGAALS